MGLELSVLLLAVVVVILICLIAISNVYAFEINTVTIKTPKGASDFDLDYYIIFGPGVIFMTT